MSIRSLLVLQTVAAMMMVVFVGHWGWGLFLVAMLSTLGTALVTWQLQGKQRLFGVVATTLLASLLYLLSAGPFQGIGRIFCVSTRTRMQSAVGWIYRPLETVDRSSAKSPCSSRAKASGDGLYAAYRNYLESFR